MHVSDLLKKVREYLHDPAGKIWGDVELTEMLNRAALTYSIDTGIFRGCFDIVTDSDGSCSIPSNYAGFLSSWNSSGYRIDNISVDELRRFHGNYITVEGEAEYVYEDLDGAGRFRFCPNPYKRQDIRVYYPYYPYGMPSFPGFGVPTCSDGYGLPYRIRKYKKTGDVVYIRTEGVEKIPDYTALIYYVLYQAYNTDSDFSSTEKSEFYFERYRSRLSRFNQMKPGVTSKRKRGKFY